MPMTRRWPALGIGDLDLPQRRLWDAVTSTTRQVPSIDVEGHLIGPYDVLLRAPELGERVAALGVHLRHIGLPQRLRVLAILAVAGRWHSEFEWWAWATVATELGVDGVILAGLRHGTVDDLELEEDDRLVIRVACQLMSDGRLNQELFEEAQDRLGEAGIVELVVLIGHYSLIAWLMNTFEIPIPPDEPYVWAD